MNVDFQEAFAAFAEWEVDLQENPENFLSAEEMKDMSLVELAESKARAFFHYVSKIKRGE